MYRLLSLVLLLLVAAPAQAQTREKGWDAFDVDRWIRAQASKRLDVGANDDCASGFTNRRDAIMNGNRITTQILNFGSISAPGNTITDIVWNGLGYGYEFGPFVAAEIEDPNRQDPQSVVKLDENGRPVLTATGDTMYVTRIVSDGLVSNGGEVSPDGSEFWGWQPIACAQPVGSFGGLQVVNPESDRIPTSDAPDRDLDGKPDSWPDDWFNETLREFVWPGALQQGASNADKESIYFMNDYNNREFNYLPFPSDPSKRGLGLEVETRIYQWANPLAEDTIFLVYKITNKSERDLDNVIFGMWGDPHVGGPGDWPDDLAFFDREQNLVYAFDADGRSDIPGREPGYFGYTFLESPGLGNEIIDGQFFEGDGIDNDGDGLVDESWTDGIDNDGDWNPELDDTGIDGIPGTGDEGEGDGVPTAGDPFDIQRPGEPNFEFTDIDESDQIGLTSFASPRFAGNRISNDNRVWDLVQPGRFEDVPAEPGDYVFLYGSGNFPLRAGETKRFSIALVVGESFEDLQLNVRTAQQIYRVGYRFAKPPEKPNLTAVPGDGQVTLYWDATSEDSIDPLSREKDFEGYVLFRSTSHEFSDIQTITDINGSNFLFEPLTTEIGIEAKFDLDNGLAGPSPIPYAGRGVSYDLGSDTGLRHTFVDSNQVINGQTYYYALAAYDRGFVDETGANGIPPSETSKTITYNPVDDSFIFDVNTVSVVPRPRTAGYVGPNIVGEGGFERIQGASTGELELRVLNELALPEQGRYRLEFTGGEDEGVRYSLINDVPVVTEVAASLGKVNALGFENIIPETFSLRTSAGQELTEGTDYTLLAGNGAVQVFAGADEGERLTATFKYAPVADSDRLAGEESNPIFDGLQLFVTDDVLAVNQDETGWIQGNASVGFDVRRATAGPGRQEVPFDYEIRFGSGQVTTSFNTNLALPFEVLNLSRANQQIDVFVPDPNGNRAWDITEPLIFVEEVNGQQIATWEVVFQENGQLPTAGDVFLVSTDKPFAPGDVYGFETRAARVDQALAEQELGEVYVVPNPYVATNVLEPRNPVSNSQRGDRRLYFANVPARCTVRIYTLAGELVTTLEHDSIIDDGKLFWDLRTKDNTVIAHGLYLFHVESDAGTFVGKFAVIK